MRGVCFAFIGLICTAGFSEDNSPYCAESVITIGIDEVSELGFAARDLLRLANGPKHLAWSWDYKAESTSLDLRVSSVAPSARYIDAVAVYPIGAPDIVLHCPDRVEVDAWLDFRTDDGAFSERWHTTLFDTDESDCRAETGDSCLPPGSEANFLYKFKRQHLNGTFYNDSPVSEAFTYDFFARGSFRADVVHADVFGHAYNCNNDDCEFYLIEGGHSN